jgi:Domain of unknown function (DUF5069)
MNHYGWTTEYRRLWEKSVAAYASGGRDRDAYLNDGDRAFLASIGALAQELYDLAEDWCGGGEPDFGTALLMAEVRREVVLRGLTVELPAGDNIPPRSAALGGIEWLPRIIAKARLRLVGRLPDAFMYCCGGDRSFLREHDLHPADFLRLVLRAGSDAEILARFQSANARGRA